MTMQSESITKQVKAIWAVLAMLTIWQITTTAKVNLFVPDINSLNRTINVLIERINELEVPKLEELQKEGLEKYEEIYEEQTKALETFDERFCRMRDMYGAGAVFDWNGSLYTTYFAEELLTDNQ
jgi:hypothetical protein